MEHIRPIIAVMLSALLCGCTPAAGSSGDSQSQAEFSPESGFALGSAVPSQPGGITVQSLDAPTGKNLPDGNPLISNVFCADPTAVEYEGRLYIYGTNDNQQYEAVGADGKNTYEHIKSLVMLSTDDMVNWKDHGEILNSSQVPWGRPEGGFMWAPDCAYKDGTYYFYFPHPSSSDVHCSWKVGIATSKHPAKDFKVQGYIKGIDDACGMIDPCVFIDDDGQAYLYHGGCGRIIGAKMKDNMMELAEKPRSMEGLKDFHEGAWVHKRNGIYYLMYSDNVPHPEGNRLVYATSSQPLGPWTYRGVILEGTGSGKSHGSIV